MMSAAPSEPNIAHGTIMFTDIVGFTEFNALRGDVEALEMLALQEQIVHDEIGGKARIVKQLGDGLMLWFEDACDAVETGLRLQERFEEESWSTETPLWVRIGLHSGRQTRRGDDLLGQRKGDGLETDVLISHRHQAAGFCGENARRSGTGAGEVYGHNV